MYFLILIMESGVPGRMIGPREWDELVEVAMNWIATETQVTSEIRDNFDMDGTFEFDNGGGVYIISSDDD